MISARDFAAMRGEDDVVAQMDAEEALASNEDNKPDVIQELSRRIVPSQDILRYILAGKSTFTIVSVDTKKRFTYKVTKLKKPKPGKKPFHFVGVMTGPDNQLSYTYLGVIDDVGKFHLTQKSRLTSSSTQFRAFDFLYRWLLQEPVLTDKIEFWHSGRCGRCGRILTVPESIANGIGPECIKKM